MEFKTDAIVVKSADYKDNDKLLTLFTADRGILRATIRGVKKPNSKLNFAAQPFALCEYVLVEKGGFYTVKSAYMHDGFYPLRTDVVSFYAANAAMSVCLATLPDGAENKTLFIALCQALRELAYSDLDRAETLVSFLLTAASEHGYAVDLDGCGVCGGEIGENPRFDFSLGCFTCPTCGGGERASESTYHVLRKCAGLDFDERKTAGGRKRALRLMRVYLGEKTEETFPCIAETLQIYQE